MCRRVDDRQQALLLLEDALEFVGEVLAVEILLFIEELVVRQVRAAFVADDVVRAPEPVSRQHLIAALRVVGDGVMDGARAARSGDGTEVALRLLVSEGQVDDGVEVLGQARDRRIAHVVLNRKRTEDALHRRDAGQFALIVHHDAHRGVRHFIGAVFGGSLTASRARTKNRVLQSLACSMRCCHTRRHNE